MINTTEKIFQNSFAQTIKAIADENNLAYQYYGPPDNIGDMTEAYWNSDKLKWLKKETDDYTSAADAARIGSPETLADAPCTYAEFKTRLDAKYTKETYQRLRKAEYPPIEDYLDAIAKGDTAQEQAYKDACAAVKTKYPKDYVHPGNSKLTKDFDHIA